MAGENPQTTMPPCPREPMLDQRGQMSSAWTRWIQQVQRVLSFTGGIAWEIVNKAGSKLSDIVTRPHSMLQSILGTGDRHITASENLEITALDALGAGMAAKTGDASYAARTITGTTGETEVSNGNGVSGNPTIGLPDLISTPRQFGTVSNNTTFEADGTPVFNGDATNWNDINVSMSSIATSGVTVMDVVTIGSNHFKAFKGTGLQAQEAEGSMEILHDYREGSDITPHIHWMPEDANTGDVKFSLGYRWWNRDDAMPAETVVSVTVAASGVQYKTVRTNFAAISGTGKTIGSRFVFRITRDPADAADTYAHYAIALDFGLHYERDTIGSRQITAK